MKIFAIGMNYALHNQELHGTLEKTEAPVIFMKADSALLKDGKPFFIFVVMGRIDYETEVVVRISRLGKSISKEFAHRYFDAVTVGIDFTARDMQSQFKKSGRPWDISKGFDGSAVIGEWIDKERLPDIQDLHFRLDVDGKTVQSGHTADMMYSVAEIIEYISRFYTLKTGDIIYTGTPVGVGPVDVENHLEGYLEGNKILDFHVK